MDVISELNELRDNGDIYSWDRHWDREIYLVIENEDDDGMIMLKDKVEDYITMMK